MSKNTTPPVTLHFSRNKDGSFSAHAIDEDGAQLGGEENMVVAGTKEEVLAFMQKLRDSYHEGADFSNAPAGWKEELSPIEPLRDPA